MHRNVGCHRPRIGERDLDLSQLEWRAQLVVPEPGASIALDTQKIVPRSTGAEAGSFSNAQWSDTVPKLVQAKVVQALDNSGYLGAVSRPMDGLSADYQLLLDIRAVQIAGRGTEAEVELAAKVLGNDGRIVAGKVFSAKVSGGVGRGAGGHHRVGRGLWQSTVELAVWVANVLQETPKR
jgi:phospholipid/cholesterol/gamma-HCH transport system substrate-binding protein